MEPSARRSFHIGRYHCTETLAQGPLGETFRAKVYGVAGLEKQYALKQIDVALRVDPEVRERLIEAARRYATVEHDRIARLTEIHDEADSLFLVTELSRGIDVPRLITHLRGRSETLPVEQAILIAADVAEALEVAARPSEGAPGGVLHLGLHPGVVSVLGEGEVRVTDFAIADALVRPGWADDDTLCPLLAYTAPERLDGGAASAAADAWALGAVLFELCAGAALLQGANAVALRAARSSLPWDKLPARAGLREALERFLAPAPADRPQSGAAMREILTGLLGLELTRARAGLQALVKRALGRTMTRTGSFATVAIPSVTSMPTLVQEPPGSAPAPMGTRSTLGAMPLTKIAVPAPPPEPKARGWAPPRATSTIQAVKQSSSVPITLPGLGGGPAEGEPPQMELAELPPSPEVTVTERTMDVIGSGFEEEGVTSPHAKVPEERIDALEPEALELEDVHDMPTRHGMPAIPAAAYRSKQMAAVPETRAEQSFAEETTVGEPARAVEAPGSAQPAIERSVSSLPSLPQLPSLQAMPPTDQLPIVPANAQPLPGMVVHGGLPLSTSERGAVERASTLPVPRVPEAPPSHGGAAWIIGGAIGLAIAIGVVFAVEKGGWSPGAQKQPTPQVETPKVETPKVEAKVETPKVEAPRVETPKVEAPRVETPKVEAPRVETPKVEAPKVAKAETPKTPKVEAPKAETPKAETPKVQAPKVEAPKVEAPKVEAPKVEAPKVEAPVTPPPPVAAGQLVVSSTPPGASVWLDGEPRGQTPLSTAAPVGKHRVIVVAPGMKLVQKTAVVEASGGSLTVALEPARLPSDVAGAGQGGLKVRCRTLGELRILVDGHDTGMSCPNNDRIAVEPGAHKIGLQSPRTGEIKEIDGEVEEDADHSTRIYVRF